MFDAFHLGRTTGLCCRDRRAIGPGYRKVLRGRLRALIALQPLHASPRRRRLTHGLPEMPAQVRLVGETTRRRDVTQGRIGRKHVSSGQLHATSHDERVR
jgi:hypothetical protein